MIICVGCPLGCAIILTIEENGEVITVSGNICREGKDYALEEYRNPVRILTSTVLTESTLQPLLPVRTTRPILKTCLKRGAGVLAGVRVRPPVKIGDVIVTNLLETGADVVASANLPSQEVL